jgi:hypothetical protein
MRYIEIVGRINEHNLLILGESLDVIKPQRVRVDLWFRDEDEEEYREETKGEILAGIREGLQECLTGEAQPISEMWDDLRIRTTAVINDSGQLILDEPLSPTQAQDVDVVIWFIRVEGSDEVGESSVKELIGVES